MQRLVGTFYNDDIKYSKIFTKLLEEYGYEVVKKKDSTNQSDVFINDTRNEKE